MQIKWVGCGCAKLTRIILAGAVLFALALFVPTITNAQTNDLSDIHRHLEVGGGYMHNTGDFGLDGFTLNAGWFLASNISVNANYDGVYDTSRVGQFEFTSVGAISSQSHLQNFLVGPRFYIYEKAIGKSRRPLRPFAEAKFGISHLKSTIEEGEAPSISNSDSAFSWMLGGGVDYPLARHWTARGNLDLLRTHLNHEGQSRLVLGLGIEYSF